MAIHKIDAKTLQIWLANDQVILIDVREEAEHRNQKIKGAKLIPLGKISKKDLPEFKNKKLVIHCQAGKRGQSACEKLLQEDSNLEIYNLEGGINSWCGSGCNVIVSKNFFLPLDRQVQLTIGSFVFFGSLLAYFVDVKFVFIPAFFGAGLIFAGLSGLCLLANLIAKMPWNK
ncbi:MAG: rhodanese-like domain-containing protein [Alphaproteobacteria bacterium]